MLEEIKRARYLSVVLADDVMGACLCPWLRCAEMVEAKQYAERVDIVKYIQTRG
jgi:hypothetical protein